MDTFPHNVFRKSLVQQFSTVHFSSMEIHYVWIFQQLHFQLSYHLMSLFSYRNKKEPVRSQQFLIKRDCDSETGLKYSLLMLITDDSFQGYDRTCLKPTTSCKKILWFSTGLPSSIFLSCSNIVFCCKLFNSSFIFLSVCC